MQACHPADPPEHTPRAGPTGSAPPASSSADSSAGPSGAALEQRLVELEIKASYTDDLLDTLNALVTRQQAQIDRLQQQVAGLRRREEDAAGTGFRSLRDELPPHY